MMARKPPYTVSVADVVTEHLEAIEARHRSTIIDKIEEQLRFEPGVETRNRKLLRQPAPFEAGWEIRFGPNNRFRVFYQIDEDEHRVQVVAVGVEEGNRLKIAGKEMP